MNDPTVDVSVVVAAHNEEVYLAQCLDALGRQSYDARRHEILIVDDGSNDQTSLIARAFVKGQKGMLPRATYIRNRHAGLSVARNTGVAYAEGRIIAFIDGDALADENWVEMIASALSGGKSASLLGGQVCNLNDGHWFSRFIHTVHYSYWKGARPIIGTNMAFRREVFDRVGGFFEDFWKRGDETAFLEKASAHFERVFEPRARVFHEHPPRLGIWLRERAANGRFTYWQTLVRRRLGRGVRWSGILKEVVALTTWPILMVALALQVSDAHVSWWVWIGTGAVLLARVFRKAPGLIGVVSRYGALSVILLPLALTVTLLGLLARDVGYWAEFMRRPDLSLEDNPEAALGRVERVISSA